MSIHYTFRDRLRIAMKNHGRYALKNVSLKSGYSPGYVRGLYSNNPRNPTIGAVEAIADALGVDVLWLLGKGEINELTKSQ